MAMSLDQFQAFVTRNVTDLQAKQADLERRFGLSGFARWWFDQPTGLLRFEDSADRAPVETPFTEVGSYSVKTRTWVWGWANGSVLEEQRKKSSRLRALAELTGFDVFRRGVWEADESLAWELTALAVGHLGAQGAYRCPMDHLHVFLAIEGVRPVPVPAPVTPRGQGREPGALVDAILKRQNGPDVSGPATTGGERWGFSTR
ncbi:MAG: DUF6882 domain-containing protein [Isosphaeraceae bacterium]